MDEQRKKELEEKVKLTPEQLQTLANFKPLAEELNRLTEQQQNNVLLEQLRGWTEQASKALEPTLKAMDALNEANRRLTEPIRKLAETIAQAALETQEALIQLGVSSGRLTDAVELFTPEVQGAFMAIFRLARTHLETGLKLKDYADAIGPDLTVKDDFLFRGELEQVLQEAAEDIAEYNRTLQVEQQINSRADKLERAKEARTKAIEAGVLMTINNHLASFSRKELANAFTSNCIFYVDDIGKAAGQFDEFGQLQAQLEFTELIQIHTAFLMFFCTALKQKLLDEEGKKIQVTGKDATIKLFLPEMAKQLGLDPRKYSTLREGSEDIKQLRLQMFKDKILPFEKFIGVLPNGSNYRVLLYKGYDSETDSILIEAPYIYKLYEIENNKAYSLSLNELFHSDITTEPTAAVELAAAILAGIKQRGLYKHNKPQIEKVTIRTKGKIVTTHYKAEPQEEPQEQGIIWRIKWETLILECPQLNEKLNAVMRSDKKNKAMYFNKILADTVKAAYRIIKDKSDAYRYYKELQFEPAYTDGEIKAPTKSQLAKLELIAKHKGKNKAYIQSY